MENVVNVAEYVIGAVRSMARLRVRRSVVAAFVLSIGVGTVSGIVLGRLSAPSWMAGLVAAGTASIFAVSLTLDAIAFLLRDMDRLIEAATKLAEAEARGGQDAPGPSD